MTFRRITMLLASKNPSKLREMKVLLGELPLELVPLDHLTPEPLGVVQDGQTFQENAIKKGRAAVQLAPLLTLADDAGLEVDALGGRPGVRSAHFAREYATDAENNAALLQALTEVEGPARSARFRCCLALFDPWCPASEAPIVAEGVCEGAIALRGRGAGGFGYDPLFLVQGQGGRTMAELPDEERTHISPRAAAVRALMPTLRALVFSKLHEVAALSDRTPSLLPRSDTEER